MLREFGQQVESIVLDGIGRTTSRVQEQTPLPADLLESDDAYLVVFDTPGVPRDQIDVRFGDRTVHVRVDRRREIHEKFEMRLSGRGMSRSGLVTLPEHVSIDPETATATLTPSGTLQVTLPKTEPTTDEPIRIETEDRDEDATEDRDENGDEENSAQ